MSFRIYKPQNNQILYSNSTALSQSWTVRDNVINVGFRNASFGQGKWIAMAGSQIKNPNVGEFVTSTDNGITWTPGFGGTPLYDPAVVSPSNYNQYVDILFGNNVWVAVSRAGNLTRAVSSPDGITWTRRDTSGGATTTLGATSFNAISFNQGQFVITGENGGISYSSVSKIFTSTDGITWSGKPIVLQSDLTTIDISATVNNAWRGVAYGNNTWVAVSADTGAAAITKRVIISTDGGNKWYSPTSLSPVMNTRNFQRVAFGNGLFVAVASDAVSSCIATSPDGITWTLRNAPTSTGQFYSIDYGNGIFIAVSQAGTNNRTITSTDGINWTILYNPIDTDFYGVKYANGIWVATSNNPAEQTNTRIDTLGYINTSRQIIVSKKNQNK